MRRKMIEDDYAEKMEFFNWLWDEKFTSEEREEYAEEFEEETNKILEPGFVY